MEGGDALYIDCRGAERVDDEVFIIYEGRGVTLFILFAGVLYVLTMRSSLFQLDNYSRGLLYAYYICK